MQVETRHLDTKHCTETLSNIPATSETLSHPGLFNYVTSIRAYRTQPYTWGRFYVDGFVGITAAMPTPPKIS